MANTKPAFLGLGGPYANVAALNTVSASLRSGMSVSSLQPVTRLQNVEPSSKTRILGDAATRPVPWLYGFGAFSDGLFNIGMAALIGTTISQWGKFRVSEFGFSFVEGTPSSVLSSSNANITAGVASIDEAADLAADGSGFFPSSIAPWWVKLAFSVPAHTVVTGNASAFFIVRCQMNNATFTGTYLPVYLDLFEAGNFIRTLGARAMTVGESEYQQFVFPFDVAELADTSCADLQARFSSGDNGTGYVVLDSITVLVEQPGSDVNTYDSGWVDSPFTQGDDDLQPTKNLHHLFDTDTSTHNATIFVLDDSAQDIPTSTADATTPPTMPWASPNNGVPVSQVTHTPPNYADAGVLVVGAPLRLSVGIATGGGDAQLSHETIIDSNDNTTAGGQSYGGDSWRRRKADAQLILTRAEKDLLISYMDWSRGLSGPFFVAFEPHLSLSEQLFTAFFATLESASKATPMSAYQRRTNDITDTAAYWMMSLSVKEKT